MDIFVSNIAYGTSDGALKKFFRTKFKEFGIEVFDCNRFRKKKNCALFTILDVKLGHMFIKNYAYPNNLFLARPLKLRVGDREPDPYSIKTLQKKTKDIAASNGQGAQSSKFQDDTFRIEEYTCGVWVYHEELKYMPMYRDQRGGRVVFGDRELIVSTPEFDTRTRESIMRIHIPLSSVCSLALGDTYKPVLTLTLDKPPRVYLVGFIGEDMTLDTSRVFGTSQQHEFVISSCWVYRLALERATEFHKLVSYLDHSKSLPTAYPDVKSEVPPKKHIKYEIDDVNVAIETCRNLGFKLKFQLQRLVWNCYLLPSIVQELIPNVEAMVEEYGQTKTTYALKRLFSLIPYPGPEADPSELSADNIVLLLRDFLRGGDFDSLNLLAKRHANLLLVHKIHVTPAGVFLEGPEIEAKNRILRKYPDYASEYFIRVMFMDEDGSAIRYDSTGSLILIHEKFKGFLRRSIQIAGRSFEFLGFSNSSLREQSCWFMAPFKLRGRTTRAKDVIESLGNFSEIRSPAKCAARIGQAFTDTPHGVISMPPECVVQVPDIERNGRTFSDGCSTVSLELVMKLWKNYRFGPKPTLFQIRQAGSKGMVSLDTTLNGELMTYRPSMEKFESPHTDLEVCGSNRRPLPFYLNQQLIKILEDLGVEAEAFLSLQANAIRLLRMTAEHPVNASDFLDRDGIGRSTNLPWLILKLYHIGIPVLEDRFIRQSLEHTIIGQLRQLKHKGRIFVEEGVTLYGIMDETNTLLEHQVYCRKDRQEILGPVAVTRSPALHPGDVQCVTAVDVPADSPLKQLDNCVVFSQQGVRDLPSQLSGGDLDGDVFNVIYDKSLMPKFTFDAADYPRVSPVDIGRPVTISDMTDHFVTFMANDQLGRIANMHKQLSDLDDDGTLSEGCKTLASLHSTSVDFPKTGIPVDMSQCPRIRRWKPDFMAPSPRVHIDASAKIHIDDPLFEESEDEESQDAIIYAHRGRTRRVRYYESVKVLGRLYRAVDEKALLVEFQRAGFMGESDVVMKGLWSYVEQQAMGIQWKHLEAWARGIKKEYDELMNEMQTTYSASRHHPLTEIEVFTGSVLGNEDGSLPTRRMRETARTMRDRFEDGVALIVEQITQGFSKDDEDALRGEDSLERSIACFHVSIETEPEAYTNKLKGTPKVMSFRYVAAMACLREVEIFRRLVEPLASV